MRSRAMSSLSQTSTEQAEVKPFEEIPGPGGIYQWPVIGSIINYKPFTSFTPEELPDMLNGMLDKYGPVVKLRLGSPFVVVSDPKDFETVYRNEGKYPLRPSLELSEKLSERNNLKKGLTDLQGAEWHAVRTPVNKRLMKADSATHYLEQQNKVADDFVKILETQKLSPEKLQELFFCIAVVTFNKRLGLFEKNPDKDSIDFLEATRSALHMIQKVLSRKSVTHKWFRNSTYNTYEACLKLIRRVSAHHVTDAKQKLEERMQARKFDDSEKNLVTEDVSNIMIALYGGGTDSTAKNLQVLFYNLAMNPDKQENLRREILDILGTDGTMTAKALSQMVYLKAALKESFRLNFPTPIGNVRILPVDVVLGGYKVPAGVRIALFNNRATRTNFVDPDQFLPERWLRSEENTKKDSAHNMIVLPFGHGPRNCIGRRFAVQEIYLAAAKVLQRLHIDVEPESAATKFIYKTFIEPERPIKFKFTKIN
ncbi:hypothetical protein Btru_073210 [Bulinus truncatus]|nr:hypothetical protein Btru_073210 [Bulinus truncatus]